MIPQVRSRNFISLLSSWCRRTPLGEDSRGGGGRDNGLVARLLVLLLQLALAACQSSGINTPAAPDGPAQTEYPPPGGQGRVVLLLSGHSGPRLYQEYAAAIAQRGYDAVLIDGKDILSADRKGGERLQAAIIRAQRSPYALPGKVGVIGFSQGGGAALTYAARLPDLVAAVVAYYPETDFMARNGGTAVFAAHFAVPILMLAGGEDQYHNCCLIETARALETSARERGAVFELIVYPDAGHGFNLPTGYRSADADDAWLRTLAMLQRHFREQSSATTRH